MKSIKLMLLGLAFVIIGSSLIVTLYLSPFGVIVGLVGLGIMIYGYRKKDN